MRSILPEEDETLKRLEATAIRKATERRNETARSVRPVRHVIRIATAD